MVLLAICSEEKHHAERADYKVGNLRSYQRLNPDKKSEKGIRQRPEPPQTLAANSLFARRTAEVTSRSSQ